jgi:tape measure domain-containing protein
MEFDNAQFERKIDSTLASLAKLEKSLKFDQAKQGFNDINTAASKFNLGNLSTIIEGASSKFLTLGTIAFTVLQRITNQAISTGVQLAKSLSLDQIISGFQEYEMNMQSIQTILANTRADGTNLGQVNDALAELNRYADQTIYNFGQMTRNIGTFTAAGVDLDTSVGAIKGISNLAAISGSSAEQAASGMYQLSQAISTGTLRLIDWNSVVNAGMGGEVFQKALFETGKTLGTIKDVPIDQTFEEWTKSGKSFRASLEDNWLTAEVLTTTLQGFTGDMTEAQLLAIGYTKEQAKEILELGKSGVEAATKVRTLTQLIQTTKEAIGSGWSESFKIVFGNFEEATELFSGISGAIGEIVEKSSKARNELLQGWKDLGGRTLLLESLKDLVSNLAAIAKPIKDAFRDIFPAVTAERLYNLTRAFSIFVDKLKPSWATIDKLKRIFKGLFAALEIGWVIIREGVRFIKDLIDSFTGLGEGKILGGLAKIGDFFIQLNRSLVQGRGIERFFMDLPGHLQKVVDFLKQAKDAIVDFFTGQNVTLPDAMEMSFGRLSDRLGGLKDRFEKLKDLWKPVADALEKVKDVLDRVWEAIRDWFKELAGKMAAAAEEGDFNAVLDALNVALLGGIAGLLAKFIKEGFTFDIGSGFLEKIGQSFEELTGVLKAMQTDLKANALLKIAGAIAILTASVVVLSLIDSDALTKALTAMAIGFGQLMGAFAILSKISSGPKGAASFGIISSGMVILSGALLLLSFAVKNLADLDWEELGRGLTGVIVLMGVMVGAVKLMSGNAGGMLLAGAGMMMVAIALNILAGAVAIFATMDWVELGKGFAAVAGGLLIIAGAMQLMPMNMPLTGAGLVLVAIGLNILAGALKIFATMSWEEIGKGMTVLAGGLLIIAGAMNLMPVNMPITGAGLILVATGVSILGGAMKILASMSWEEIGKGLTGLAGSLLILAVATNAMTGAIAGAAAIMIVSLALTVLVKVVKELSKMSWGELAHGLGALAAVLGVLAIAALLMQPALGAMFALGAALVVIGAGFALFGFGAAQVAKAFEILAKAGAAGAEALEASLKAIGKSMSALGRGIAEGVLEMLEVFADAAPVIAEQLVVILGHILGGLRKLIPEVVAIVVELIEGIFQAIRSYAGQLIETGLFIITSLLTGIRDNIGEVVTLVGEIIVSFLEAFAGQVPGIVAALVNLWVTILTTLAFELGRLIPTLLIGLGKALVMGFITGINEQMGGVISWALGLAGSILGWIGSTARTLWDKGWSLIEGLALGIAEKIVSVTTFFQQLPQKVFEWIGSVARKLYQKGLDFIQGLWEGLQSRWESLVNWLKRIPQNILNAIPNPLKLLYDVGSKIVQGLKNGIESAWSGLTGWLGDKVEGLKDFITNPFGIFSPSRVTMEYGKMIVLGLQLGMEKEFVKLERWMGSEDFVEPLTDNFNKALSDMTVQMEALENIQPVITPVLDLTTAQRQAASLNNTIGLTPFSSLDQARIIAASQTFVTDPSQQPAPVQTGPMFEQNIYSPTQLSATDIYKQTRNQIALAKEELNIV